MTKRYNKYLGFMVGLLSAIMVSCGGTHDEPTPPTPEPGTGPEPETPEATRTVLVYMVANNNMGGIYDYYDLKEMVRGAGDIGSGRLIVYHKDKTSSMLKEVTAEGIDTLEVYDYSELAVSADMMSRVLADAKMHAPADEYGLVLWSHASGWLQTGIEESGRSDDAPGPQRTFGLDGSKRMNVTTLASVLEGQGLSFVYFDCCYMGSVEVMYQMRNVAPVMIASPTEDPIYGMPYDLTIKHLFAPEIDYKALARTTFDYYNDKFKVGDCPCTMTVVRTAGLDDLAEATRLVYQQADVRWPAGYEPQRYSDANKCWYYDFGDYVKTLCKDEALYNNWQSALDAVVEYAAATPYIWDTIPITRCSGLSTYIFSNNESARNNNYNTLDWYGAVVSTLF